VNEGRKTLEILDAGPGTGLEKGKNAGCGTWGHAAGPASGFLAAGFYDPGRGRKRREKSTD
jgi:hypothetical protein